MEGSRFCNGSRPCRNVGHVGAMRSERPWGAPVCIASHPYVRYARTYIWGSAGARYPGEGKTASHPYLRYARKYIGGSLGFNSPEGQIKSSLGSPRDFPVKARRRVGDGRGTPGCSEP